MKKLLFALVFASTVGLTHAQSGAAYADQKYIGEVFAFAGEFCPAGSLEANGQLLSIPGPNEYLFSIIGTRFGGDGQKTFGLPHVAPMSVISETPVNPSDIAHNNNNKVKLKACIVMQGLYPNRPTAPTTKSTPKR